MGLQSSNLRRVGETVMQVTCDQLDLHRALGIVSRVVPRRVSPPITKCVLVTADTHGLSLAATDLELSIGCRVKAKVKEQGSIALPAQLFTDFVNTLPPNKVSIAKGELSHTAEVKCQRIESRISGIDADEFPPLPLLGAEGINTQVDASVLKFAISQVAFAAATDDIKLVRTGCLCEFEGDTLTLAAADGFRLAVRKAPLSQPIAEKASAIAPARALKELRHLIADCDEPIGITINITSGTILFRFKDLEMASQLINGSYPDYSQLIPTEHTTSVTVDRHHILAAMRVAATMASRGSEVVRMDIEPGTVARPGQMTITAKAEEVGDNQNEVFVRAGGPAIKIAFNYRYVLDVLRAINTEEVEMEFNTPTDAAIFRPVGDNNYVHVIMPMTVKW